MCSFFPGSLYQIRTIHQEALVEEDKLGVFKKLGYFLDGERKKEKLHEKTN